MHTVSDLLVVQFIHPTYPDSLTNGVIIIDQAISVMNSNMGAYDGLGDQILFAVQLWPCRRGRYNVCNFDTA
jgi:hypothetical protein